MPSRLDLTIELPCGCPFSTSHKTEKPLRTTSEADKFLHDAAVRLSDAVIRANHKHECPDR